MAPVLYSVDTSPPCRSVLMLAKAIGLSFDVKTINLTEGDQLKPEFLKLNPQHIVPTLDDEGFVIWDSHAINAYLISKYASDNSLYPTDAKIRAVINQRLHFGSGIVFSLLFRIAKPLRLKQINFVPEDLKAEVRDMYGFLEAFLIESKWVCGDFVTIADIHLVANISSIQLYEPLGDKYPNIKRWLEDCSKQFWYEENIEGLENFVKLFNSLIDV